MNLERKRISNGRYRDLMAQTALVRLWRGQYKSIAQLAIDCEVNELTARGWMTWWRQAWGVHLGREDDGELCVANWGAVEPNRLEAWIKSGRAADGALVNGLPMPVNYVPWTTREWPPARAMGDRPAFVFRGDVVDDGRELSADELPL